MRTGPPARGEARRERALARSEGVPSHAEALASAFTLDVLDVLDVLDAQDEALHFPLR